jgi:hypothetical protein
MGLPALVEVVLCTRETIEGILDLLVINFRPPMDKDIQVTEGIGTHFHIRAGTGIHIHPVKVEIGIRYLAEYLTVHLKDRITIVQMIMKICVIFHPV